jgi:hypothetical protein
MGLHENASSLAAGETPAQFDAHIIDFYAWHNRVLASLRDSGSVFQTFPFELRMLCRWGCWNLVERENGKPTKVPFNARTGKFASVTNPDDWCDFETAVAASINYSGIGFCFFKQDGFCGIDLDVKPGEQPSAQQIKIHQAFSSYSEFSPSGRGLHIICKAKLPGKGRRRGDVEIYDDARFFTMTGIVHNDPPITDRQELVKILYDELGGADQGQSEIEDQPERESDERIIIRASNAKNSEKFKALFAGNWERLYSSQSEADLALINIVQFYTKSHAQIARLFAKSELGKAPKDNHKHRSDRHAYVAGMIQKSFDRPNGKPLGGSAQLSNVCGFSEFTSNIKPPDYVWHHVFQLGYLYLFTALWGAGKTAIAITIALHVAIGLTLCGHKTKQCRVLFLCGENPDDVRLRVLAACAIFNISEESVNDWLVFTRRPFAIDDAIAIAAFIEDAKRFAPFGLLIVDTGPAHSSADDENDNRAMHAFAIALRALMEALGNPATMVLMHPPKSATRETMAPRGGGALSGSADGELSAWNQDGTIEFAHRAKFRGSGFDPINFALQRHEFPDIKDNFGECAISIVAVPTDRNPNLAVAIKGSNRVALDALCRCADVAAAPSQTILDRLPKCDGAALFPPFSVVHEDDWRARAYEMGISGSSQHAKAVAFSRSRKALIDMGLVHTIADYYWLSNWCVPGVPPIGQSTLPI